MQYCVFNPFETSNTYFLFILNKVTISSVSKKTKISKFDYNNKIKTFVFCKFSNFILLFSSSCFPDVFQMLELSELNVGALSVPIFHS